MIHGKNRIGFDLSAEGKKTFSAFDPSGQQELPEKFSVATEQELDTAVKKAEEAFQFLRNLSGKRRAEFLRTIADEIESLGDSLIERVVLETGLPSGRIMGERGRTTGQLRLFAQVIEEGSWVDASIDRPQPQRKPLPKPDIRKMLKPIGVVGIFTASNFPLAFSTAGGDTVSALAAGNPVIIKAHPYHPGSNEMVANAITKAAIKTGMPDGIFSSLNADDHAIGQALVLHPGIKAVTFTGSFSGGKALYDLAQTREAIIPVFAEMGSINPVLLLPNKLHQDYDAVAKALSGSICMGAGQFCTNPGIMIGLQNNDLDRFKEALATYTKTLLPETMLHPNIAKKYHDSSERCLTAKGVTLIAKAETKGNEMQATPIVISVNAEDFVSNKLFSEEVFGPFSVLVECKSVIEASYVLNYLQGQLTTTIWATPEDIEMHKHLVDHLQKMSGRILFNGVPTGVEVCYSMQHGGPYPATTDSRFTSVGVDAIKRFVRPVAFQNAPQFYLPDELKDDNPLDIWRKVDGELSKEKIN